MLQTQSTLSSYLTRASPTTPHGAPAAQPPAKGRNSAAPGAIPSNDCPAPLTAPHSPLTYSSPSSQPINSTPPPADVDGDMDGVTYASPPASDAEMANTELEDTDGNDSDSSVASTTEKNKQAAADRTEFTMAARTTPPLSRKDKKASRKAAKRNNTVAAHNAPAASSSDSERNKRREDKRAAKAAAAAAAAATAAAAAAAATEAPAQPQPLSLSTPVPATTLAPIALSATTLTAVVGQPAPLRAASIAGSVVQAAQLLPTQPAASLAPAVIASPTAISAAIPQPIPASAVHTAAHQQQQQQQQPNNSKTNRPRPFPASDKLVELSGTTVAAPNSLVLVLTPVIGQPAGIVQRWNNRPRLDSSNTKSLLSTALLLSELNLLPPATPSLFNELSTVEELLVELHRIADKKPAAAGALNIAIDELTAANQPSTDREQLTAAALHQLAATLRQTSAVDEHWLKNDWAARLTTYSGCMTSTGNRQENATVASSRPPFTTCKLRLDFASPLSRLLAQHYLTSAPTATTAPAAPDTDQPPQQPARSPRLLKAHIEVRPYRRRYCYSDVTGFTFGPMNPGANPACTSVEEPYGNWQLLQQYLRRVAPNCYPTPFRPLPSGVAVVRFVHEEQYQCELRDLVWNKAVAPEYGITRPPKLTMQIYCFSTDVACSTCGKAGHSARACPNQPAAGIKTCRRCFSTEHLVANCPTMPEQTTCGLCSKTGHSTRDCSRYGPQRVNVKMDNRQNAAVRHNVTFAQALIYQMQGKTVPAPAAAAAPPAQPPNNSSLSHYPPLRQQSGAAAPPAAQPATQPALAPQPASSALEQQMRDMMQFMQKQMDTLIAEAAAARAAQTAMMSNMFTMFNTLLAMHMPSKAAMHNGHTDNYDTTRQHTAASSSSASSPTEMFHRETYTVNTVQAPTPTIAEPNTRQTTSAPATTTMSQASGTSQSPMQVETTTPATTIHNKILRQTNNDSHNNMGVANYPTGHYTPPPTHTSQSNPQQSLSPPSYPGPSFPSQ